MAIRKVLFLIYSLERGGGAERVVSDQIQGLDRELFDCSLCLLNEHSDTSWLQELALAADHKKLIHFPSLLNLRSWWLLIRWLRRERFDLIYSHLFFANLVGRIAGRLVGVKQLVATEHNVYLRRPAWARLVNRLLARRSSKIVAVSQAVKDYLVNQEKINGEKVEVVYNGVDLARYRFKLTDRERVRSEWHLDATDFAVLSIGQVTDQKNYDLLIDLAAILAKRGEAFRFFVAGEKSGSLARELETRVKKLGLEHQLNFLGRRDDIPACLAAADAFLMPSRWEGFGLALVEAMACGRPVLVNNISTLREIVGADNEYGLMASNPGEFADFLLKLKGDALFYGRYQELALKRAIDFSAANNLKNLTKLFLSLK